MIELYDVTICYKKGNFRRIGLKEYFMRRVARDYQTREFRAVNGVSFRLEQGQTLGIIGTNGAGKSTLLKAVSGVIVPTRGHIQVKGRIAALLELGSGFDGDLNVRENTYLRGALLGYTRQFIDEKYKEILDFSGLEDFESRPFSNLSSGMKVRLAFSIAAFINPEILILDEVLAVGDGAFRVKSEKRMKEIINGGATTILVSHSLEQVRTMCNKVLWLHKGKQIDFGETKPICNRYQQFLNGEFKL